MSLVVGLPVDKTAANVFTVLNDVSCSDKRALAYVWTRTANLFDLKLQPGDPERLWDVTAELLQPYL